LAASAKVNKKTKKDDGGKTWTALDIAIRWNYQKIIDLLKKYGAKTSKELEIQN
jgi:hypothetical protein